MKAFSTALSLVALASYADLAQADIVEDTMIDIFSFFVDKAQLVSYEREQGVPVVNDKTVNGKFF